MSHNSVDQSKLLDTGILVDCWRVVCVTVGQICMDSSVGWSVVSQ